MRTDMPATKAPSLSGSCNSGIMASPDSRAPQDNSSGCALQRVRLKGSNYIATSTLGVVAATFTVQILYLCLDSLFLKDRYVRPHSSVCCATLPSRFMHRQGLNRLCKVPR